MPSTRLPMFPLGTVLFPHAVLPLHVFEPRYRALMRDCLAADRRFGVVLIERGSEVGGGDQRSSLGTRGAIARAVELADGRWLLEVRGETRVRVQEWLQDDPYPVALVDDDDGSPQPLPDPGDPGPLLGTDADIDLVARRVRRARALLAEHGGGPPLPPDAPLDGSGDSDVAAWQLCAAAPLSAYDAQRLLAADTAAQRLHLLGILMEELEVDLHRVLTAE